ncbi:MAG: HigA family addiction module antitoxin [Alphaproteobacteria bacterium]
MAMKDNLPPVHPGEYIADGIEALKINQSQLADLLGCSRQYVNNIIKGHKPLTTDICILLPAVLGSTPEFWSGLQQRYDLKTAAADAKLQKAAAQVAERMAKLQAKSTRSRNA